MWTEILLLSAAGATAAYVVDPQFKNAVNTAIASATGAPSTSQSSQPQSASTNTSNIGAGWQQIMSDLSQIFQNQQQLQQEYSNPSASTRPALNITYPSNGGASGSNANNTNSILSYLAQEQAAAYAQQQALAQQQAAAAAQQQQAAAAAQQQAASNSFFTSTPLANSGYTAQGTTTTNPSTGTTETTGYLFGNTPVGFYTNAAGQNSGFFSPASLSSTAPISSSNSGTPSSSSNSGFSVAAAQAAGYTVTPSASAPGGYVLSTGGNQLNIYGNPISSSTPITGNSSLPAGYKI
jgi:hypothetical protein